MSSHIWHSALSIFRRTRRLPWKKQFEGVRIAKEDGGKKLERQWRYQIDSIRPSKMFRSYKLPSSHIYRTVGERGSKWCWESKKKVCPLIMISHVCWCITSMKMNCINLNTFAEIQSAMSEWGNSLFCHSTDRKKKGRRRSRMRWSARKMKGYSQSLAWPTTDDKNVSTGWVYLSREPSGVG